MVLSYYDAEIEKHKQAILALQRERVKASIEARRVISEESARRSAAKKQTEAA
jgi:hypothetical protein